ncbi:hypothetical protein K0M31_010696 [Melipona bicolor]|uniref:Uncharacterized protein n=1 Tax=Melipona bicolor TaxID=60889 RepID=A0AA40FL84_9HYME|nr:hypothetical protein K0M31_010696 [Melipona bicolor]
MRCKKFYHSLKATSPKCNRLYSSGTRLVFRATLSERRPSNRLIRFWRKFLDRGIVESEMVGGDAASSEAAAVSEHWYTRVPGQVSVRGRVQENASATKVARVEEA